MKDRWKILIASLLIGAFLGSIFLLLGFSFKEVGLREYGILQYTFYGTVDVAQTVRKRGSYLVGLDYQFITYPKGLLKHEFSVSALTKDKSMITMQGVLLGQLIESDVINMHFNYGQEYFKLVGKTAEQAFRESIEQFLLTQVISTRTSVDSYISSSVCLSVESAYSYFDCQYVSSGAMMVNAAPVVLGSDISVQLFLKNVLEKAISSQKKMNVYGNGGFDLIQQVQTLNSQLFLNTTKLIVDTVSNYTTEGSEVFAGASYILSNPLMPLLNNNIAAIQITDN